MYDAAGVDVRHASHNLQRARQHLAHVNLRQYSRTAATVVLLCWLGAAGCVGSRPAPFGPIRIKVQLQRGWLRVVVGWS